MEISEKLDLVQKHVRASTKENARAEKSGMSDMFDAAGYVNAEQGHANLIDAGKVRNLDAPRKRPKNPPHWKKEGERLELMDGAV